VTTVDVADVLDLPDLAQVDRRVTKKLLASPFADTTPADARLIARAVASAKIAGILRPETIQVPAFRDKHRQVVDVAVLDVTLAEKASNAERGRLLDLLHRGMARPLVVFLRGRDDGVLLSLALTHVNRTDPDQTTSVIEAAIAVSLADVVPGSLRLANLSRTNMWALYQDLVRVAATGGHRDRVTLTAEEAITLRHRLTTLESELAIVVRDAKREKNQQGRITLNTRGRQLRSEIEQVRTSLYSADKPEPTVESRPE
jgi:hypothetical protein